MSVINGNPGSCQIYNLLMTTMLKTAFAFYKSNNTLKLEVRTPKKLHFSLFLENGNKVTVGWKRVF